MNIRQYINLFFVIIVTFTILLIVCPCTYSQLSVIPSIVELNSYPGALRTFTINVDNTGELSLSCTMKVSAMKLVEGMPVEADDSSRSCKNWISVKQESFKLKPKGGQQIVCRLQAPPKDVVGGYYAIISCLGIPETNQNQDLNKSGVSSSINFSYKVLSAIMLTVPGPNLKAIIEAGIPMLETGEGGKGYTIKLPLRNLGNIHTRMSGTAEIRSEAGQLVETFTMGSGRGFILPEHERLFTSKGLVNLSDGLYTANITLNTEKSNQPMKNSFQFYVKDGQLILGNPNDEQKSQIEKESAGFIVSTPQLNVEMPAGGRRTQSVELVNLTKNVLKVKATPMEWYRSPEGHDVIMSDQPSHNRSAKDMILLLQNEIELRPMGKQKLIMTVSIPKGIDGEYYASVAFDRADIQLDNSPQSLIRRSVMLSTSAQGTGKRNAEIREFTANPKPNGAFTFTMRFKNIGGLSIDPDVSFTLTDEKGDEVGKIVPTQHPPFIQAGGEGIINADWLKVLNPGLYTVQAVFRFDPNQPPITQRASFAVNVDDKK
jgi:hypothetical protein